MNLVFHVLLYWAAFAGLVLSIIMSPHMVQNPQVKKWRRFLYCAILGPTVWCVLLFALLMAVGMFIVQCDRTRRAKKAKP